MGKLVDPKFPQWQRKNPDTSEGEAQDDVLGLLQKFMSILESEVVTTVVQLAALRLIQKAVIGNYQLAMGSEDTKELLRQAQELASEYMIRGHDGTEF